MKKKPIPEVEQLSEESKHLYDVLNNESDLACVLIASSYLDYALASLLKRHLIKSGLVKKLLDSPRGAISTFAARSDLAYIALVLFLQGFGKTSKRSVIYGTILPIITWHLVSIRTISRSSWTLLFRRRFIRH